MAREYSTEKIRQALALTNGNAAQAHKLIIDQAFADPKLLNELVRPHMTGIVAHAVGRIADAKAGPEPAVSPPADNADSFGLDILKTIAGGDTAQFGQEAYARPLKKQGVSQTHIDAIAEMVKKSQSE